MTDERAIDIRAAVSRAFGAPLVIETVRLRAPRAAEVRVRIDAVAICQSDLAYIDNHWGGDLPAVWGHEAAGTVVDAGPDAGLEPGTRLAVTLIRSCGTCPRCRAGLAVECTSKPHVAQPLTGTAGGAITHGMDTAAFAEQVLVHRSQVVPIPDALSSDVAALLACGVMTGFGAVVNTAGLADSASVVVIGSGGVGLHAVQGARIRGAHPIVAVDPADTRLRMAERLGATHALNPIDTDPVAALDEITSGRMADAVFVTTGARAALEWAYSLVAPGGTLVLVGMPPTGVTMPIDVGTLAARNQRVLGSKMGTAVPERDLPRLVALYQHGELHVDELITGRYPFERINEAIESSRRGEGIRNVILFDPRAGG
jgi:Zn-dependent alcohol dehydrogenase